MKKKTKLTQNVVRAEVSSPVNFDPNNDFNDRIDFIKWNQ